MKLACAIVLALASSATWADSRKPPKGISLPRGCRDRGCVRERAVSSTTAPGYAFFEFAPTDGAGMGAACACAAVTGAKGEAMTFTRASSGTCLKGGTTSGIANGDLVTCSTDQPRVMPGGDGTGGLGLLVEGARTNICLRSEAFDNAAWVKIGSTSAAPVATADQAVAPDGMTTADQVVFAAATTGVGYSGLFQTIAGSSGTASHTVWIRGTVTTPSGSIDLCSSDGVTNVCTTCAFVQGSWSRCSRAGVTRGSGTDFMIGNMSLFSSISRSAATVYLWGAQVELGAFSSSYIATAGSSVARATEDAYFAVTPPTYLTGSVAATVVQSLTTDTTVSGAGVIALQATGSYTDLLYTNSTTQATMIAGGSGATRNQNDATSPRRFAGWWNASNVAVVSDAQTTAAAGTYATFNRLYLGAFNAAAYNFAVLKLVCWDPSDTRCR